MILAGDLGGTKANLGLFEIRAGKLAGVAGKRYATHEYKGLEEVITDFLNETKGKVTAASFGIAGPVVQNRVHATNFPWIVDGASLAEHLGVSRVRLLNDLEAAWSLVDPILDAWIKGTPPPFPNYPSGSQGPKAADDLITTDGRRWRPL